MSENLEFNLKVKQNDLSKSLYSAETQARQLQSAMESAGLSAPMKNLKIGVDEATSSMSELTGTFLGVAAGQIAFNILSSAISFLKNTVSESVGAFADQEDAINRLSQSLKLTDSYSESAVQSITDFASSLESVSKFSDDAIVNQIAFVRSLGATTEQAKAMVQAGANLSATLGGSLEENVDKLGKTLSGTAGRLAQYIPELKSLTDEQLKAGAAADIINKKFSGASAADLNTYNGQVAALKNSFNNLQEGIGQLIVQSAPYQLFLSSAKKYIDDLNVSMNANAKITDMVAGKYDAAAKTASQLTSDSEVLGKQLEILKKELQQQEDMDLFDGQTRNASALLFKIQQIEMAKKKLDDQLKSGVTAPVTPDVAPVKVKTEAETNEAIKRNNALLKIQQDHQAAMDSMQQEWENSNIEDELTKNEAELVRITEFDARKKELEFNQKIADAQTIGDTEARKQEVYKLEEEKRLALIEIYNKREIESNKLKNKKLEDLDKQLLETEKTINTQKKQDMADTLNQISTLQTSGNQTLVAIGKTAALAQLAISGPVAFGKAMELGPIIGPPLAAAVAASFAVQAGKIAGVKFENGGIVGASTGPDNRVAQVRDGEMILNASQQKNLYDMINNGGNNGDIIVQIGEVEVARAVRRQIQSGFQLA